MRVGGQVEVGAAGMDGLELLGQGARGERRPAVTLQVGRQAG